MRRSRIVTIVHVYASPRAPGPLGRGRAADVDIDDHGAWLLVQVHACGPIRADARAGECTCTLHYPCSIHRGRAALDTAEPPGEPQTAGRLH
jgi:hypothetical protein